MNKQCKKIMAYLVTHGSITVREAFVMLGINSPTRRLTTLNDLGFIRKERVSIVRPNAQGKAVEVSHYMRYLPTDVGVAYWCE